MKLSGWGNFPIIETNALSPRDENQLVGIIESKSNVIARGNGRAYGDSAMSNSVTINMKYFNRLIAFDENTGQLIAESGVVLSDIIASFLPRGWFPAVTPGTQFVTLGGMIAADVHGKNHHKDGSFRRYVDWIDVIGSDGKTSRCSQSHHPELFDYTLGGMGLTGIILRAAIRLRPVETAWIRQRTIPAPNLKTAMQVFENENDASYSVAWIDCLASGQNLGRSLVMIGEHAHLSELNEIQVKHPLLVPEKRNFSAPMNYLSFALNSLSVKIFNSIYYTLGLKSSQSKLVSWQNYFYPLDAIIGWNKIYGRKGFVQFQCVLPIISAEDGLTCILEQTAKSGLGSFLAVLKKFGPQESAFSFPMAGYTLALDFPITQKTFELLNVLDEITIKFGGRFYLAKDSRMTSQTLRESDNRVEKFIEARNINNWRRIFKSSQAERLSI